MQGKVWLVGAGPGDAGLLTLRGKEVLEQADVVVYDALVGDDVLAMIPESAELIYAGKRAGRHTFSQPEISRILLQEAQKGKCVVRLKGGDPFLFGRGGEELEVLVSHGISFEVVPGVTSAFAVPAYNGIPVTYRNMSSSVHVITGHRQGDGELSIDYDSLVKTGGTFIFLMGITSLEDICTGLLTAGMDPVMPAAVLEKGSTAHQRRISSVLCKMAEECRKAQVVTPAILIVGKVCSLADRFQWQEKRPLAGLQILVTRPGDSARELVEILRAEGAQVIPFPTIRTVPCSGSLLLKQAMDSLKKGEFNWIVFTSPAGVRFFFARLFEEGDARMLGGVRFAVIGEGSRKALAGFGIHADFMPSVYDGQHLGAELARILKEGDRVMIPRAAIGNPELVQELSTVEGIHIEDIPLYETLPAAPGAVDLSGMLQEGRPDAVVFTSASTVRGFAAAAGTADLSGICAVCIGRQTGQEAQKLGMSCRIAARASVEALAEEIRALARERRERING